jgi:hypothetical protein
VVSATAAIPAILRPPVAAPSSAARTSNDISGGP